LDANDLAGESVVDKVRVLYFVANSNIREDVIVAMDVV
jgi:hypothetical protein